MSLEHQARVRLGAMLSAATSSAALFSLALAIPELGLLALVSGLPLGLCLTRLGRRDALSASALAIVAIALWAGPIASFVFSALPLAPVLLLADAQSRGQGFLTASLWATAWSSCITAIVLIHSGPQLREQALAPLRYYQGEEFLAQMRQEGVPDEQVEALAGQFAEMERGLRLVYPAAFLIFGWISVLFNGSLLRAYAARRSAPGTLGPGFEELRFPLGLVVAFVLCAAALVFPPLRPLAYNALVLVGFLYGLQGLAIVVYFAHRLQGPRLLRAAVVIMLVFLIPAGIYLVLLTGLFDTWFDFRRWAPRRPEQANGHEGEGQNRERG